MSERLLLLSMVLMGCSGVPGLLLRRGAAGERMATALVAAGAALGAAGVSFCRGGSPARWAWPVPGGELALAVDGLSAVFLLPIFVVFTLGSLYGQGYWPQAQHPDSGPRLRFFYGLTAAAMVLVVLARNGVLFLVGWEVMALGAFFLVTAEEDQRHVREAGWVYLVATRCGTLCLLALFTLLQRAAGSFSLAPLPSGALDEGAQTAVFVLALLGFGLKAGLMPLHVWLPGAHANAPSHVSAAMSGVLIKMGVYGLARLLSLMPPLPPGFGVALLGIGALSAVLGIAFAVGQQDLKRVLAYSSIENVGIITIGVGLAVLGRGAGRTDWIVLGMGGALFHVINHGLFKPLLFLAAGAVAHGARTRELDLLGGLVRAMPRTALCFLVGAMAICGLPPLNGFAGELLLYMGLLRAATQLGAAGAAVAAACAVPLLALVGALALACFVRLFGALFLGHGRSPQAAHARECGPLMGAPMAVLAGGCALLGLAPALCAPLLDEAVRAWAPDAPDWPPIATLAPLRQLTPILLSLGALLGLLGALLARRVRRAARTITWDCGYAAPSATMQYTASSLGQMLVRAFSFALGPRASRPPRRPLFLGEAHFRCEVPDPVLDRAILPAMQATGSSLARLRFLQQGSVHAYIFYIFATLIALLWR